MPVLLPHLSAPGAVLLMVDTVHTCWPGLSCCPLAGTSLQLYRSCPNRGECRWLDFHLPVSRICRNSSRTSVAVQDPDVSVYGSLSQ